MEWKRWMERGSAGREKAHNINVSIPKQRGRTKSNNKTPIHPQPHPRAVHLTAVQRELEIEDAEDALEEVKHAGDLHLDLVLPREDVRWKRRTRIRPASEPLISLR